MSGYHGPTVVLCTLPPTVETSSAQLVELVGEWREVAVFFMLRLVLAQCVETALLLDRIIFLRENGMLRS